MATGQDRFDIEKLKTSLPFVKRIGFELITDPATGNKIVKLKPELTDGSDAIIDCPDMPTTDLLIDVIAACCHQVVHPFVRSQKIIMGNGNDRIQAREPDDTISAAGPNPLPIQLSALPGLPGLDDVIASIAASMGLASGMLKVTPDGCVVDRASNPVVTDDGSTPRQPPSPGIEVEVKNMTDEQAKATIDALDEFDAAIQSSVEVINE